MRCKMKQDAHMFLKLEVDMFQHKYERWQSKVYEIETNSGTGST